MAIDSWDVLPLAHPALTVLVPGSCSRKSLQRLRRRADWPELHTTLHSCPEPSQPVVRIRANHHQELSPPPLEISVASMSSHSPAAGAT
jgi:hypothetical protein